MTPLARRSMYKLLPLLSLIIVAGRLAAPAQAAAPASINAPTQIAARPPLRVVFLGDSLTFGLSASARGREYQALLFQRLLGDGRSDGLAVSVFQDPVGLTDNALERVPAVLAARPDIIFVEIGNHEAFAGGAALASFPGWYDELLTRLQESGALIVAGSLTWLNYPPGSRQYADALSLNAMLRALCAAHGIAVAELWGATLFRDDFIARPGEPAFYPPYEGDNLHLNDAGHAALAEAFWQSYQRAAACRPAVSGDARAAATCGAEPAEPIPAT